ncbi:MAG: hypothetical protein MI975_20755 [Cytophagales bacterium]|nr:hypothetical protein [Cytophagales bacterium]
MALKWISRYSWGIWEIIQQYSFECLFPVRSISLGFPLWLGLLSKTLCSAVFSSERPGIRIVKNISIDLMVFLPAETSRLVLFLCSPKEKGRKRKGAKIKDQDTRGPHKPTLHKMFCLWKAGDLVDVIANILKAGPPTGRLDPALILDVPRPQKFYRPSSLDIHTYLYNIPMDPKFGCVHQVFCLIRIFEGIWEIIQQYPFERLFPVRALARTLALK